MQPNSMREMDRLMVRKEKQQDKPARGDFTQVYDPFHGKAVQVSDKLTDRLRGKYACGPHLPNGNPEFGWRQFQAPPIQHEAAERIEALEAMLRAAGHSEAQIAAGTSYVEVMST